MQLTGMRCNGGALTGRPVNTKRVQPFTPVFKSRSNTVHVVAGEKRSANRTKWSRMEVPGTNGAVATPSKDMDVSEVVS